MNRKAITGPRIVAVLIVLALALTAWAMLRKPALEVEAARITSGPMAVTIDDIGETRVRDLYTLAAPVTGELLRVPFKAGAEVVRGQTLLAEIQPTTPNPVDARSYATTVANIGGLQAQLAGARARVQEARAGEQLAQADFSRVAALLPAGFVSRARYDQSQAALAQARAARTAATQGQDAALHALQAAQASLRGTGAPPRGQVVRVQAPVSGTILRVLEQSNSPVVAGTHLMELGDPTAIEIVSDMLSADAVKVRPGAGVTVDAWGGEAPLRGRVRLVEPFGFTKISALGVEEQRVNVVIDLVDPRAAWLRLGHGYRVTVRVELWAAPKVRQVPLGALFRQGEGWAVFAIDRDGRARLKRVKVGQMNDSMAELLDGLGDGEQVILHPGEKVKDGVKVRAVSG
jgi:HlyD family secretion protein